MSKTVDIIIKTCPDPRKPGNFLGYCFDFPGLGVMEKAPGESMREDAFDLAYQRFSLTDAFQKTTLPDAELHVQLQMATSDEARQIERIQYPMHRFDATPV